MSGEAVDRAFELFPLEFRAKKVLIKPNVLRASEAGEGIVTHPAVLRAVVEKVETMGPASIVVGDNPGVMGYGANEESFQKNRPDGSGQGLLSEHRKRFPESRFQSRFHAQR